MRDWRTTTAGILAMLASFIPVVIDLLHGTAISGSAATLPVMGATTALGLYHASDSKA